MLTNKVALITGASQGLGKAVALALAKAGARVVINYHPSQENNALAVQRQIEQAGGKAIILPADITIKSEVEKLFSATIQHFQQLDILINNAGVMMNRPLDQVSEADFDLHFDVNVKGTFFACQQAAKWMKSGGKILNFSSSVTGQMYPNYSVYAATKGAIDQLTRHLAKELGPKGISINAIAPGPSNTDMFVVGRTPEQLAFTRSNIAYGRLGEPEDIAAVVLLLLSEQATWINGQTIKANGGFI